jgi:hypothetical protein
MMCGRGSHVGKGRYRCGGGGVRPHRDRVSREEVAASSVEGSLIEGALGRVDEDASEEVVGAGDLACVGDDGRSALTGIGTCCDGERLWLSDPSTRSMHVFPCRCAVQKTNYCVRCLQ